MFTTAFLILVAVEAVILLGCLYTESTFLGLGSFALAMLIARVGLGVGVPEAVTSLGWATLGIFAGYLLVGAIYSVFPRWFLRMRRTSKKLRAVRDRLEENREAQEALALERARKKFERDAQTALVLERARVEAEAPEDPPSDDSAEQAEFDEAQAIKDFQDTYLKSDRESNYLLARMTPSQNKATITGWIAFWPLDLLVLAFEEPVQRIFEWLSAAYRRVSEDALKQAGLDDLASEVKKDNAW